MENNCDHLSSIDNQYIDEMYKAYCQNPYSVDPSWKNYFEENSDTLLPSKAEESESSSDTQNIHNELNVARFVDEYRKRGHLFTLTNPVRKRRDYQLKITLERFGLNESLLDSEFQSDKISNHKTMKLRDIQKKMTETYCGHIGYEFMFIRDPEKLEWLTNKIEVEMNKPNFTAEEKRSIYDKLNETVLFEKYLHNNFVGQKRFSIEGVETFIPAIESIVEYGGDLGIEECVIGMAHRGRLNVLVNVMNKPYIEIFSEFEGKSYANDRFNGDVKYHLGYSSDRATKDHRVHLSIPPNPSHLEAVNTVVQGIAHSKIQQRFNNDHNKLIPILIHGDAAVAGQGINYEILQYSLLDGYKTGGAIHIVLNNQIGFTTSYLEARSSTYCTDLAKVTKSPVFHVNGDDVEAVIHSIRLALEFRQHFNVDVFIDILGYRRHGHNEGDEPRFTHPMFYNIISNHLNPKMIYQKKLLEEGVVDEEYLVKKDKEYLDMLDNSMAEAKKKENLSLNSFGRSDWLGFQIANEKDIFITRPTGVQLDIFNFIAKQITYLPDNIVFFKKVYKIYQDRYKMVFDKKMLDWGMAEQMAYGSLLNEGFGVRLSGQDSQRGTFSHRHALLRSNNDGETKYIPLQHVSAEQGDFTVLNSILSEYGILGFEYGYAMSRPNCLTLWEAQFGDFANGAQIIIDQFIVSGESKWQRMNGLVMLLPHGYEGQGPEHSSARPERFLQLCAESNIQVLNLTTPANLFHALRRQIHRNFRKPLIIFTPKSLLRHPLCVSKIEDFLDDTNFQDIIDDHAVDKEQVKKVLLCSGKIYYELLSAITERNITDTALIRIEQLYPLNKEKLLNIYEKYSSATQKIWVQEEPENQGSGQYFILENLKIGISLTMVSRKPSSSVSTGFYQIHNKEQKLIVEKALR